MRLAWLTDIHLNFLGGAARTRFAERVGATGADAVVITGDIAEAPDVDVLIAELAERAGLPAWFVLGNYDFYRGSIAEVRARVAAWAAAGPTASASTSASRPHSRRPVRVATGGQGKVGMGLVNGPRRG